MNIKDNYRRAINTYSNFVIDDDKVLKAIKTQNKSYKNINTFRRCMATMITIAILFTGITLVGVASGRNFFMELFLNIFDDSISAEMAESGKLQPLDIVNENDDFILKLVAFTGDIETHIVLFELTPKVEMGEFDKVELVGQTFSPSVLEANKQNMYYPSTIDGYQLTYDADINTYYFSYKLPPYWVKDNIEDIVLRITNVYFYNESKLEKTFICDMIYQFSPDREMLDDSLTIEVNRIITKDMFNYCAFTDTYDENMVDIDTIVAPVIEGKIQIDEVIISNYCVEIDCIIIDETLNESEASYIWNQFTEPRFVTKHYWNGIESKDYYEIVAVDNTERIRLFVDNVEIQIIEETLSWLPGKGHDSEGNPLKEGEFGAGFKFEGIEYENAQTIEIRFGDEIIPLK